MQETNASGAVTLEREYDPWGVAIQGGATSGYSFTGREWDAEIGLSYYRARYYLRERGKFMSDDPAGLIDGPNRTPYALNAPTRYVDPTGLAVGDWWDIVSNLRRAREIAGEELSKRSTQHSDVEDGIRHAEWMRRTAEETNTVTAWLAGFGHEVEGMLQGQPLNEMVMDLHNNQKGREAKGGQVDPRSLITLDRHKPYIPSAPRPPAKQRPYSSYPKSAEGGSRSGGRSCK